MTIDTNTAQLILDALAWSNKDWMESMNWNMTDADITCSARADFVRFCRARGIDTVERKVKVDVD